MSFVVKITPTKLARFVGAGRLGSGSFIEEVNGFEVRCYKNGEEIRFDRKTFYVNAKKEAGLYALGLENFYKHLQEE